MKSTSHNIVAIGHLSPLQRHKNAVAYLILCALTFLLHYSALNGYWRFDDGDHLRFAATYAPWQYFFQPSVTLLQSYANVAPYNAFFYDLNLMLFGMVPSLHYAHLVAVLLVTAIATYKLIGLWQPPFIALLASALFLAGVPTLFVGQQLMTGHYATGLLFTVLSLYCFTQGVRRERYGLALLGAMLYLFATTCKEVFVPLVLLLPAIPAGTVRDRLKAALPYALVAGIYTVWRYAILGRFFGGYIATDTSSAEQFQQLASIPLLLAGWAKGQDISAFLKSLGFLYYAGFAAVVSLVWVAANQKRLSWVLIPTAAVLLILPLVPLTRNPGLNMADRYLFLPWWACSVLLAVLTNSLRDIGTQRVLKVVVAVGLMGLTVHTQRTVHKQIGSQLAMQEALYHTILEMDNNTALLPPPDRNYYKGVLSGARRAATLLSDSSLGPAKVVEDKASLCEYSLAGNKIVAFDASCNCTHEVTNRLDEYLSMLVGKEVQGVTGAPLMVKLTFQNRTLSWELGPFVDGTYAVIFGTTPTPVPAKGQIALAGQTPLQFRIRHQDPDGKVAMSPALVFDIPRESEFTWTGLSVVESVTCIPTIKK